MAETHSDTAAGTPHERSPVFRTDPPPLTLSLSLSVSHSPAWRARSVCQRLFTLVIQILVVCLRGHCSESIVDRSVSSSPIHAHAHQTKKRESKQSKTNQGKGKKGAHKEGKEKRGENNSRRTDWTLCRDVVHRPARSGFLLPTTTTTTTTKTTHTHTISGLSNSCAKAFLAHCAVGW
jgi:hypothetical protein